MRPWQQNKRLRQLQTRLKKQPGLLPKLSRGLKMIRKPPKMLSRKLRKTLSKLKKMLTN